MAAQLISTAQPLQMFISGSQQVPSNKWELPATKAQQMMTRRINGKRRRKQTVRAFRKAPQDGPKDMTQLFAHSCQGAASTHRSISPPNGRAIIMTTPVQAYLVSFCCPRVALGVDPEAAPLAGDHFLAGLHQRLRAYLAELPVLSQAPQCQTAQHPSNARSQWRVRKHQNRRVSAPTIRLKVGVKRTGKGGGDQ